MRVLFYAANPEGEESLRLEQEITELQLASLNGTRRIDFIFLPAMPFEDIGEKIINYKPDVVHISAHGTGENLFLANTKEHKVSLTAEALNVLLAIHPPKLLYLSACHSLPIARAMIETVPFAIGTTEDIRNLYARKGAVNFYRCVMQGLSLKAAHESSRNTIRVLSHRTVDSDMAANPRFDASRQYLYERTRIVCCFEKHDFTHDDDQFSLELGIAGCPNGTHQVVFCTDDPTFMGDDDSNLESDLCSVECAIPTNGEIWLDGTWEKIDGDFRIYCFGLSTTGEPFAVGCTACEALVEFYKVFYETDDGSAFPTELKNALAFLRDNDGSRIRPKAQTTRQANPTKKRKPRGRT
jgi:hypothetical protein